MGRKGLAMKAVGIVLTVVGILGLVSAGVKAPNAPNPSYLVGIFLPGIALLVVGLKLIQKKKPDVSPTANDTRVNRGPVQEPGHK